MLIANVVAAQLLASLSVFKLLNLQLLRGHMHHNFVQSSSKSPSLASVASIRVCLRPSWLLASSLCGVAEPATFQRGSRQTVVEVIFLDWLVSELLAPALSTPAQ